MPQYTCSWNKAKVGLNTNQSINVNNVNKYGCLVGIF
jgi:hypothetical protein